jgi:1-deoxyxylulose-5-phosphate synthase
MELVNLGRTGVKVSRLCLGCMTYGTPEWRPWVLDEESSRPFIRRALELGITFFDTADMYSLGASEEVLGRAVRDFAKRDELVIATKVYNPVGPGANDRGLSRKHILAAIENSLRRLRTDYVDLYVIHRFDDDTPVEETLEALDTVVRHGKARYVGASSMHAWQFMKMLGLQRARGLAAFVSMQNHYNLVYREEEREMLPLCRAEGIGVTPWSPLARGRLAGSAAARTLRSGTDEVARRIYAEGTDDQAIVDAVAAVAAERGVPPARIALAWLLSRPAVTAPVIGASKPHHLDDAVAALSIGLSDEEIRRLEAHYRTRPVAGHR